MPANVIILAPAVNALPDATLSVLTLGPADPTPENIVLYPYATPGPAGPVIVTLEPVGIADSWPRFDQVAQAVTWYQDGVLFTGAFDAGGGVYPAAGNVDHGIQYGPTGTDYTGTLEQPDVADVRSGTQFGADGTEFMGTLATGGAGGMSRSRVVNA